MRIPNGRGFNPDQATTHSTSELSKLPAINPAMSSRTRPGEFTNRLIVPLTPFRLDRFFTPSYNQSG